jgi:hypothetical protein
MRESGRVAGDETAARPGDVPAVPGKHAIVLTKPTIRTDRREAVYPDFAVPSCNFAVSELSRRTASRRCQVSVILALFAESRRGIVGRLAVVE